jgi:hypothetical protein
MLKTQKHGGDALGAFLAHAFGPFGLFCYLYTLTDLWAHCNSFCVIVIWRAVLSGTLTSLKHLWRCDLLTL